LQKMKARTRVKSKNPFTSRGKADVRLCSPDELWMADIGFTD